MTTEIEPIPIPQVVIKLTENLGEDLTAVIGNVRTRRSVREWSTGRRAPRASSQEALRNTFQVVTLLSEMESPGTIRAWFIGMNPALEDHSPALEVGKNYDSILAAAHNFLAHG